MLERIGYDTDFFMELDAMVFEYCFFHMVAECEDIVPGSLFIIDKKIPMSLTHMHSSSAVSLQSCLIDEFPCTEELDMSTLASEMLLTTDKFTILCSTRILKKAPTRKSWWLLQPAECLEICRSI